MQRQQLRMPLYKLFLTLALYVAVWQPGNAQGTFITNGSASATGNNCFTITPDLQYQSGSVWSSNLMTLNANFDLSFQVYLGNRQDGADGMAFVLQPISTGTGSNGGGMGYAGISPSLAVEFDTYSNNASNSTGYNDPVFDHISLQKNGDQTPGGTIAGPVQAGANASIKDGAFHSTRIIWNAAAKNLQVYFDNVLRINYQSDVVASIFNGNPNVYWGFTGSTGYFQNAHQFCVTSVVLQETNALDMTIATTNVTCNGGNTGSASASFSGGVAPYTFLGWSNGANTPLIGGLAAGNYTATVRDANNTTISKTVTVTQPAPIPATASSNGPVTAPATIQLSAGGGASYSWTGPNGFSSQLQNPNITNTGLANSGIYYVTVRDNNNCTATATTTVSVNNGPAGALHFDGQDDVVVVQSRGVSLSNTSFSVEFWARPASAVSQLPGYIVGQGSAGTNGSLHIGFRPGGQFTIGFFGNDLSTVNPGRDAAWHHWASTYNMATGARKIYRDGQLIAEDISATPLSNSGSDLVIGAATFGSPFNGEIDELRVWTKALTACEINTNMNCQLTTVPTTLSAYYQFNQGFIDGINTTETTLQDASGNGFNGSLTNFSLSGAFSNWVAGKASGTCVAPQAPVLVCPGNITVVAGRTLLAYYPMSNGILDSTGNNGNLVLQGNFSPVNNGICQNGNYIGNQIPGAQNVQTPAIAGFTDNHFSFEVDFKITANPSFFAPVIMGGPLYRWMGIYLRNDGMVGIKYNNSSLAWSNRTLSAGQWYKGRIEFENNVARLYINDILVLTQGTGTLVTAGDFVFTTSDFSNAMAFNGCIKNLRIYSGISAGNTVKVDYNLPATSGPCTGAITQLSGLPSGSQFPIGTTTNTFQLDFNGTLTTCSFDVTVRDNEVPAINCPQNIVQNNDANSCGAIVNYDVPAANDNHTTNSVIISAGCSDGSIIFSTPATANVTSVNFLSAGAFSDIAHGHGENNIITVELYNSVANVWVPVKTISTGTGDYHFGGTSISFPSIPSVTQVRFTSTEIVHCAFHFYQMTMKLNSTQVVLTNGLASGSYFPVGNTTNTFTATDSSGNTSICSFVVTVKDTQKPTISNCTGSVQNAQANCQWTGNGGSFTLGDNCTGLLSLKEEYFDANGNKFINDLFFQLAPGAYNLGTRTFPMGVNTVRLTVTDSSGNVSAPCSFTVRVADNTAPVITAPSNLTVNNTSGSCVATLANILPPQVSDNCGIEYIINDHPLNVYPVGATTITWTARDIHGNISTVAQTITVVDSELPVILGLPVNMARPNDGGQCGAVVSWSAVVATDNCGVSSLVTSHAPGSVFPIGTTTVTYTATDVNGNIKTGAFTITVTDIEAPSANCRPHTVVLVNGLGTITPADINNNSADNCGIVSYAVSKSNFTTADLGNNTVILTVTDQQGNTSSCTAVVTVTNPSLISSPALTQNTEGQKENPEKDELTVLVSPNPASVAFQVTVLSKSKQPVSIAIMDAAGRRMELIRNLIPGTTISMGSKLASGSYVAEVVQEKQRKSVKLIKLAR